MSLQKSLIQTIAFYDLFDYPLTAEDIQKYLFDYRKPVHIKEIKGTLNDLAPEIERLHDFYVLKGRGELIDKRKSRRFISEKLWNRVHQYTQYLTRVPFIEMVAVCNNLAYHNAGENSDIDLFIVIKEGRMWTARLIATAILHFFGVRRHGDKVAGRFCLSFFVTEKQLNLQTIALKPIDPYLGYWCLWLAPIYGKEAYQHFITANHPWLKDDFGFNLGEKELSQTEGSGIKKFGQWLLGGHLGNSIERMIKGRLKPRAETKAKQLGVDSGVIISDDMLKFHDHDKRREFFERWNKKTDEITKNLEENANA